MIPASDLWMLGLRPIRPVTAGHMAPTSGAAQPMREMGEMFPDQAARPRERLTVGLTCSLHWGSARKLLAAFRQARPDIALWIEDLREGDLEEHFKAHRLDVVIAPEHAAQPSWRAIPLWRERLIVALPEASPLAKANAVSPNDLRDETLLLAGDDSGQRAFEAALLGALGQLPAVVMHHPVERDTILDLVALGAGVTACPGSTAGAFYPGVCYRPIDSDKAEIGYSLMWTQAQPSDALDAFIALARQVARGADSHGKA